MNKTLSERHSGMDVQRVQTRRYGRVPLIAAAALVLAVLTALAIGALGGSRRGPAIERATIVTDVARKGTLIRSVGAQGVFAAQETRIASATQAGVVDRVFVKPGSKVYQGTVIAEMDSPALQAAVVDARSQLNVAQANLTSAVQEAESSRLREQAAYDDIQARMEEDALQAKSLARLHEQGLVSNLQYEQAQIEARKSRNERRTTQGEAGVAAADAAAKIAAAQAQVDQARAQLAQATAQLAALTVRASAEGIVQTVAVEPGMSIAQNTEIARIADVHDLKAVLQVAESDLHDVAIGLPVMVDTGAGVVAGRVSHIAPSAANGTVAVDVAFDRPLPPGTRPDASADGTIQIASIPNAVSIARPAGASDNSTVELFKVTDNGKRAVRIRARLGRGSADRVQVLSGVDPGDILIVSDVSAYLDQAQLTLR